MQKEVINILKEDDKRNADVYQKFDPISGIGSIGERVEVRIDGFPLKTQYIPVEMLSIPLVKLLISCGSIIKFLTEELEVEYSEEDRLKVIEQFVRLRCRYDFAFWAALYVFIKNKGGGEDVLFRLTRPQRKFVERLEKLRKANKPIRIVLLKARQ
ncbi:hypothetical protein [Prevotella melaninogenica]|uniref:hypothetical protein n=1 Tax=Prevotella melaninogenica TaxID=28132 RepID=UPI003C726CE2